MSNTEWAKEVDRRKTVTAVRKGRDERKKAKEALQAERAVSEVVAAAEQGKPCFPAPSPLFAPHDLCLPPGAWGGQGSQASVPSSSLSTFSLSPSAFSPASPTTPHWSINVISFHGRFVIAFDRRFVAVRHFLSAKLVAML